MVKPADETETVHMPKNVARVGRASDTGRWWLQADRSTSFKHYASFDDLPEYAKPRIAVLLISPVGFRDEQIGRRIADDAFWVFY